MQTTKALNTDHVVAENALTVMLTQP